MSTLKKAYAFVKKYWGSDDDVLPSDLNRYEDGIDDLYSVTNKTNTNIGNLSNLLSQAKSNIVTAINEIVTNLQSEIETRGNTDTELERQINVLSTDRGYKDTKLVPNNTDFNTITDNGIYWANAWVHKNIPTLQDGTRLNGVINVYFADSTVYQFFHSNKGKWFREKNAEEWTEWQQVATTTKTDILVAPNTGYTITFNKSCKINNIAYINVRVKKTDGSEFISGAQVTPFTLPLTAGGETNGNGNGASGGFWRVPATVLFTGNTVVVNPTSNCTQIHITGVIVL